MTEREAVHLQNDGADADDLRRMLATIIGDTDGVYAAGDLTVTEKSGTPNMSVDVAAGRAFIKGTITPATQGTYFVENDAVVNLAVAASDPTNARKDIVVAQVEDAVYSGVVNAWKLAVVTGTPASPPVVPATPANSIKLAEIDIAALATTVVNGNLTDTRSVWNRGGFAFTTFTPTVTQGVAVTMSNDEASYMQIGRFVVAFYRLTFNSAGTANQTIELSLPVTAAALRQIGGSCTYADAGTKTINGYPTGGSSTSVARFEHDDAAVAARKLGTNFAVASGDVLLAMIIYQAA